MTLTAHDQRAVWDECERQWERLRRQFWRVYLPSGEWEDIRAEVFARVFRKIELWDPAKGCLSAWSGTVIRRAMMNAFRRSLPSRRCHNQRTNLQHARPIEQRVVCGDWGDEQVVTEPELPAPDKNEANTDEFRSQLSQREGHLFDALLRERGSVLAAASRLRRDYNAVRLDATRLRAKWDAYTRGEEWRAPAPVALTATVQALGDLGTRIMAARAVQRVGLHRHRTHVLKRRKETYGKPRTYPCHIPDDPALRQRLMSTDIDSVEYWDLRTQWPSLPLRLSAARRMLAAETSHVETEPTALGHDFLSMI